MAARASLPWRRKERCSMVRSHRRCVNCTSIVPGHQKARVHHQVRVLSLPILHADRVWTASAPQVPSTATSGDGHVGVDAPTSPRGRCACPEIAQRPRHPSACCHTLKPPLHRALQHPSKLLLLTRVVFALVFIALGAVQIAHSSG